MTVASLFSMEAQAFECTHTTSSCITTVQWKIRKIPYVVRAPTSSPIAHEKFIAEVKAAAEAWNKIDCSDIQLEYQGFVVDDEATEVLNEVSLITTNWLTLKDINGKSVKNTHSKQAGLTVVSHYPSGTLGKAVIYLNLDTQTLTTEALDCNNGGAEALRPVLVHEFGHFLGIAHPCEIEENETARPPAHMQRIALTDEADEAGALLSVQHEPARLVCPVISCTELLQNQPEFESLGDRPTMWPETFGACDSAGAQGATGFQTGGENTSSNPPRSDRIYQSSPQQTLSYDDSDALCSMYPRSHPTVPCHDLVGYRSVRTLGFGCSATGGRTVAFPLLLAAGWMLLLARRRKRRDPLGSTS